VQAQLAALFTSAGATILRLSGNAHAASCARAEAGLLLTKCVAAIASGATYPRPTSKHA